MKRFVNYTCVLLGTFVVATMLSCGNETREATTDTEELAAQLGDWTFTKKDLREFLDKLPEAKKLEYDTPQGHAEIADRYLEEEMFYREAIGANLDKRDDVKKMIQESTRQIMLMAFYRDAVVGKARPSEQEIHDYYEAHADAYTTLPIARAQHIFCESKEKIDKLHDMIFEGGEKMTTLAHQYSEDTITRADGGDLGFFNPGGYIRGVGFSKTFNDTVFNMDPGVIYGPIKWEKGWSLIRVTEIRPAELRPYDEVKEDIAGILSKQRIDSVKREVVENISKNYDYHNFMAEYYHTVQRSPAELFELAQNTTDSNARIAAFQEIVDKFPNSEHAPKALFMMGFVYAEELTDYPMADRKLSQVLREYPKSDVAESARWMLKNMGKPLPKFEGLDDFKGKIQQHSNED